MGSPDRTNFLRAPARGRSAYRSRRRLTATPAVHVAPAIAIRLPLMASAAADYARFAANGRGQRAPERNLASTRPWLPAGPGTGRATAVISGRTIGGAFGIAPEMIRSRVNPAVPTVPAMSRLQRQPAVSARHGRSHRSCHRASRGSVERTCSSNNSRPSGRSTRLTSDSAAANVGHRAQHERGDGRVERRRGERQPLGRSLDHLRRPPQFGAPCPQPPRHVRARFGQHELGYRVRVVAEVEPGPGAHLDRRARGACRQVAAELG